MPYIQFDDDTPQAEIVKLLEKGLQDHPEDELRILRFLVPKSALSKSDHEKCLIHADRLLQIGESDYDTEQSLFYRALVLFEDKIDLKEAEEIFIKIIDKSPDHDGAYDQLIVLYRQTNRLEKSLEWATKMAQQDFPKAYGLAQRAQVLLELDRTQEALKDFETVLASGSYQTTAQAGLAKCHLVLQNYQTALEYFREAHESCHYPEPIYAYGVGLCYQHLDDPYRAMKWYSTALEIDPMMPEALNNMATLHHELNNGWEEAVPFLLKAVTLSNEEISRKMQPVYRNLWAYYKNILDHNKAEYYSRLSMKCLGLDDDAIDFFRSFDDPD